MSDKNASLTIIESIGSLFAVILSWTVNHSVFWAFIHLLFGWLYVAYFYCCHGNLQPIYNFLHSFF